VLEGRPDARILHFRSNVEMCELASDVAREIELPVFSRGQCNTCSLDCQFKEYADILEARAFDVVYVTYAKFMFLEEHFFAFFDVVLFDEFTTVFDINSFSFRNDVLNTRNFLHLFDTFSHGRSRRVGQALRTLVDEMFKNDRFFRLPLLHTEQSTSRSFDAVVEFFRLINKFDHVAKYAWDLCLLFWASGSRVLRVSTKRGVPPSFFNVTLFNRTVRQMNHIIENVPLVFLSDASIPFVSPDKVFHVPTVVVDDQGTDSSFIFVNSSRAPEDAAIIAQNKTMGATDWFRSTLSRGIQLDARAIQIKGVPYAPWRAFVPAALLLKRYSDDENAKTSDLARLFARINAVNELYQSISRRKHPLGVDPIFIYHDNPQILDLWKFRGEQLEVE
jgi:hypothetical protein